MRAEVIARQTKAMAAAGVEALGAISPEKRSRAPAEASTIVSCGRSVTADSRTWLRFGAGEASILWSLLRRKIRLRGSPRLLRAFARCFPS